MNAIPPRRILGVLLTLGLASAIVRPVSATTVITQAENAVLAGGCVVNNNNSGWNGTGFVNFPTSGGTCTFNNVNAGSVGGSTTIFFRAALLSGSRTGTVTANGVQQNITFNSTGSFSTWANTQATVTLNAGTSNTIVLASTGQDLANVDELQVVQNTNATRTAWKWPFTSASPFNRPIANGATYTSDAHIMDGGSTINYTAFTPRIDRSVSTDPTVTVYPGENGTPANCLSKPTIGLPVSLKIGTDVQSPPPLTCPQRDGTVVIVEPDGNTAHTFYKFYRDGSNVLEAQIHRNPANGYVVTGEGWNAPGGGGQPGTSASGMADISGCIRIFDLNRTDVPYTERIRHTLACGHVVGALRQAATQAGTYKWPATNSDSSWAQYAGTLYIGELLALPKTVDINSLGLNADGKSLAWTLQNFGVYVRDTSGNMSYHAEIGVNGTMIQNMINNISIIRPYLKKVNNNTQSTPGGGTSWPSSLYPAPDPVP